MHRTITILGALLVALAIPLAALAGAQVPFKGADTGVWGTGTHSCGGSLYPVYVDTTGVATHVGRYTYRSQECVNFGNSTYLGTFTLTAADGNVLSGTYTGTFTVDSAIHYEQTNTVTGGSGHFSGASGSFDVSGVASLGLDATDTQVLAGTISTVGSSK